MPSNITSNAANDEVHSQISCVCGTKAQQLSFCRSVFSVLKKRHQLIELSDIPFLL
jgi:hypothetical protein